MTDQDDPDISSLGGDAAETPRRTFWGGLRAAVFGEEEEATLRDQIEEAIDESEEEAPKVGDLTQVERQMLRNMLHFGEKSAGDAAVPRSDIIAVDCTIGFDELVAAFADASPGYTIVCSPAVHGCGPSAGQSITFVGGTSAATPLVAGMIALVAGSWMRRRQA